GWRVPVRPLPRRPADPSPASAPAPPGRARATAPATARRREGGNGGIAALRTPATDCFDGVDGTRSGPGCQGPAVTGQSGPGGSMAGPGDRPPTGPHATDDPTVRPQEARPRTCRRGP